MKGFLRIITCLYAGIIAINASEITFNGKTTIPDCNYIEFEIKDYGSLISIKKVKISERALQDIPIEKTLVIPGRVNGKDVYIENGAFANLYNNFLCLKLKFTSNSIRRGDKVIKKYVEFPTYCNGMFSNSLSVYEVDLRGVKPTQEIERTDRMFEGCFNLEKVNLGNLNLSKAQNMSRMFYGCTNLTDLAIGTKINISKVGNAKNMFDGCKNLRHLQIKFNKHISADVNYDRITNKFKFHPNVN